jgi:hypothetical protein
VTAQAGGRATTATQARGGLQWRDRWPRWPGEGWPWRQGPRSRRCLWQPRQPAGMQQRRSMGAIRVIKKVLKRLLSATEVAKRCSVSQIDVKRSLKR